MYPINSRDVINVLAIFSHGISFEKNLFPTWGLEPHVQVPTLPIRFFQMIFCD